MKPYIFKSDRLGFRNWSEDDLPQFSAMNADEAVMEHFPSTLSYEASEQFMRRLKDAYITHGYTYYAVDVLSTGSWIGFIGLSYIDFEAEFTPGVDIGWRLKQSAWGYGYATEGAKRCMAYAREELDISKVVATCTEANQKSQHVMKKVGMNKKGYFCHPKLKGIAGFESCLWYEKVLNANESEICE